MFMHAKVYTPPYRWSSLGLQSREGRFAQAISRRRVRRGVVLMSDLTGWMWALTGVGFLILVVVVFVSQMRK